MADVVKQATLYLRHRIPDVIIHGHVRKNYSNNFFVMSCS